MLFSTTVAIMHSLFWRAPTSPRLVALWLLVLLLTTTTPTTNLLLLGRVEAYPYQASLADWNLNQNTTASDALQYWGEWANHSYTPSPDNWRMPTYTISLDRFSNGDPANDEANGTRFEHDWMSNQFRFGGDVAGLMNDLDYIQGMGIGTIYLMGSPFINQPWQADSYSPLDFTVLDAHHGRIQEWRDLIDAIHERGMYVILDNTMATMGNLLGFKGAMNKSASFEWDEYDYEWMSDRHYVDFAPGDQTVDCTYPRMWDDDGWLYNHSQTTCRDSEFDLYGDSANTGSLPVWENQLAKYGSVQDRLREWRGDVLAKIKHFSCIQIAMLDIDGFRMDKALQSTVDALAEFADAQRACARGYGKDNFFIYGEIIGTAQQAAIYVGRGKQPDMYLDNVTVAAAATNETDAEGAYSYIRDYGLTALDGSAFQYIIYGPMTRFLGLDGDIGEGGVDFVNYWNQMLLDNDFVNANTGKFDPRHMMGVSNQDVFRWPALTDGTQRQLLSQFIAAIELPGVPALFWGEEQSFYLLDNTADNYLYGRQPMSSSRGWQLHGCYKVGASSYVNFPVGPAGEGCSDDQVSLDHKDPSHPVRNIIKRMYELRRQYPVLNDGYMLENLSNQTKDIYLPGSDGIPSPTGMWSVYRSQMDAVQDLSAAGGQGSQGVWLLYTNENETTTFTFDCQDETLALLAPFAAGTTVKNLFYPYDELVLENSTVSFDRDGTTGGFTGCLANLTLDKYAYKAYVPVAAFAEPAPTLTKLVPSHDERVASSVALGEQQSVPIEMYFSKNMSCRSVTDSITINSTTQDGSTPSLSNASCAALDVAGETVYAGQPASQWVFRATLTNVAHGLHTLVLTNASAADGLTSTNVTDRVLFRLGATDNPVVFPQSGNYSTALLHRNETTSELYLAQRAAGADKFRYSRTWGSSWSDWADYTDANVTLADQPWSGTASQAWTGEHVMVQYWSQMAGSSDHIQHGDLVAASSGDATPRTRRWPHAFVLGAWNSWGYDAGLAHAMELTTTSSSSSDANNNEDNNNASLWRFDLAAEFPTQTQINVWGMNPDGQPDKTMQYGDVDGDGVLDWLHPDTLSSNDINITGGPAMPHMAWRVVVNDGDYRYQLEPTGNAWYQLALFLLLAIVPLLSGIFLVWIFQRSYYQVKFNQVGIAAPGGLLGRAKRTMTTLLVPGRDSEKEAAAAAAALAPLAGAATGPRRTVLIATMEYEIEDWNIKIKIGGLGKMASLMGSSALGHQNLVWVIPCVGGIDYPIDQVAEPMVVTINDAEYLVSVQYHIIGNITFVLLDAPVFRERTKADPYPPRMDDIESAIYYSAWNACIAETINRFQPDLYHINDYHGALAPLYILPRTIPVCLSLHNAEFQGMWSLRSKGEMAEICSVFNLSKEVVKTYVQFDKVFNMLYAGASYLRQHQGGYGAVGVSKKYGTRAYKRYPIFWGLSEIGSLPNPDPDDMAEWDGGAAKELKASEIVVDEEAEQRRGALRVQAQQWAGLDVDANAELFVFVGRWSLQKGVDLIADIFPQIMDKHKNVQLICIGPTIDNHGKFAALKLEKIMKRYPGRVYSKPEFTPIPPFVFSGAEFALMPSRDEPFGLVAVEFGRKGALCVGSRVGGLGQMPGWWFTIESTETKHLLRQFKSAIKSALASTEDTRRQMRARSLLQRFPVRQWVHDLEVLQTQSIQANGRVRQGGAVSTLDLLMPGMMSGAMTPIRRPPPVATLPNSPVGGSTAVPSPVTTAPQTAANSRAPSRANSRPPSPNRPSHSRRGIPSFLSISSLSAANSEAGSEPPSPTTPKTPAIPARFARSKSSSALGKLLASRLDALAELERGYSHPDAHRGEGGGAAGPSNSSSHAGEPRRESQNSSSGGSTSERPRQMSEGGGSASGVSHQDHFHHLQPPNGAFALDGMVRRNQSVLTLDTVVGDRKDFELQKVEPFFNDPRGQYYTAFGELLEAHEGSLSSDKLCVEEYIRSSEKDWFAKFHDTKLGKKPRLAALETSSTASTFRVEDAGSSINEFNLADDYQPPTGLKKIMLAKIGDWPVYAFFLALGQIIAANSYQITLLTGQNGQSAEQVYITSGIYLGGSIFWWLLFRHCQLYLSISLAFAFYGAAFFVLGMIPFTSGSPTITGLQYTATALYAVGSSSGFLFFTQNFLTEGGNPVRSWMFRACTIQGTQQIYIAALWYWGSYASALENADGASLITTSNRIVTYVTVPIAVFLWAICGMLFHGLPDAYRSKPGYVSGFYRSLVRRKVVVWFLVVAVIQNYFLSTNYGRSWNYLWSSDIAPAWAVAILAIIFFVGVWAAGLAVMAYLSNEHSWALPLFAIGLGAPRWAQSLWGTSGVGLYLPWASGSSAIVGVLVARGLWLWLGVLDALQGVGFGMILLQTLGRFHVSFTVFGAQVIGSAATIAARASAPNKTGPGPVFPNLALDLWTKLDNVWFWLPLMLQLVVCVGFFRFFRKEQLFKP